MRLRSASLLAAVLAVLLVLPAAAATEDSTEGTSEDDSTQMPPEAEQIVDLTFPTDPEAWFGHDYHDARGGGTRVHMATDLVGEKLWPLYAAVDGTICRAWGINDDPPSWGYSVSVCGNDGRRYAYLHLNNDSPGTDDGQGGAEWAFAPDLAEGMTVERGQFIAYMGDSGNAEGSSPHLHFEIHDPEVTDAYGEHRIDPYYSLEDALERGDVVTDAPAPRMESKQSSSSRLAGPDRIGTAVALSKAAHDHADTVVLVPSTSPSEALIAGPLAAALGGPVLTTPPSELDERVHQEMHRLGVRSAVLIGDLDGIDDDSLHAADAVDVQRIQGGDVFETATLVADRIWDGHSGERRALLALGRHDDPNRAWPDALMASYHGAATGTPVLLTDTTRLPTVTASAVDGVDEVTVFGGTAAIDAGVAARADELAGEVRRLWGQTRYGTAAAVAEDLRQAGLVGPPSLWVATGHNWPDAATSGPVVAAAGGLLVLVDGFAGGGDGEARAWVESLSGDLDEVVAIGGVAAVADEALTGVSGWLE